MQAGHLIRAASRLLAWFAGVPLLAMMLVTVVDVLGRYALGKPLVSGHAAVQALVFVLVFLGLPLLSLLRATCRLNARFGLAPQAGANAPTADRSRHRGLPNCVRLQFLWQGAYYNVRGRPSRCWRFLGGFRLSSGGLCLLAALLTVAAQFLPPDRTKR